MQRRKFSRGFKLEAVKLVRERGVSCRRLHAIWICTRTFCANGWEQAADPGSAFPGHGVMKPEQQEIERLRRELTRMKAERDILKKCGGLLRQGLGMRFEFIAKHRGIWSVSWIWPVSWICEALGVSRSGFHAWLVRAPSARARSDEEFGARVRASFISSYRTYGARRVWHDLLAEGLSCGLHRIERLMRVHGLKARPRRSGLPKDDGLRSVIADNLLDRQFTAEAPNQKWIADFTPAFAGAGSTSGPRKGGYTSPSSSTCSRAGWSAGR